MLLISVAMSIAGVRKMQNAAEWQAMYDDTVAKIKAEIDRQGLSDYRIAKDLEISQSVMTRFRCNKGTLSSEVLFKLMNYLGIFLTVGMANQVEGGKAVDKAKGKQEGKKAS